MKKLFTIMLAVAMMLSCFAVANAEGKDYSSWPEKDITIAYYTKTGSGGDLFLRQVAAALERQDAVNGHHVYVENLIDPTGVACWGYVEQQPADGYYLAGVSSVLVSSNLLVGSPVDYKNFSYILGMGLDHSYAFCRADAPYDDLPSLVEYCKAHPYEVNWANAVPTAVATIQTFALQNELGIEVNRITYDTGTDATVAVLGGFADLCLNEYSEIAAQVEAGEFKILFDTSSARGIIGDIPVLSEYGIGFNCDRPRGIIGQKDLDPELIARIDEVFCKATEDPEFIKYCEDNGIQPIQMHMEEMTECFEGVAQCILDNMDTITGTGK